MIRPERDGSAVPFIVVSECLGFSAVRYNGRMLGSRFVDALRSHARLVPICPEVGIGLGVPRDPVRIEVDSGAERLLQPSTGADLTGRMTAWATRFLESVGEVDGFVLKSRSPSCGLGDVERFSPGADGPREHRGDGMFTRAVFATRPRCAVETEAQLTRRGPRHDFLTRVFTAARLRSLGPRPEPSVLARFHSRHRAIWSAYRDDGNDVLGEIVHRAASEFDPGDAIAAYRTTMAGVMVRPRESERFVTGIEDVFRASPEGVEHPYPRALMRIGDRDQEETDDRST